MEMVEAEMAFRLEHFDAEFPMILEQGIPVESVDLFG